MGKIPTFVLNFLTSNGNESFYRYILFNDNFIKNKGEFTLVSTNLQRLTQWRIQDGSHVGHDPTHSVYKRKKILNII